MDILSHPVLVALAVLAAGSFAIAFKPQRWSRWLLPIVVLLLFALPRAGITLQSLSLPLPLAHVVCALLVLEWLIVRPRRSLESGTRFGRYFLGYAAVAGFALAMGLSGQNRPVITFIELCLYLFSMGLFFYASETFFRREDFLRFVGWMLIAAVGVSVYGLAQLRWGAATLIPHVTYSTGGSTLSRSYLETGDLMTSRVLSSYGDPNVLAGQLLVFAALGMALLLGRQVAVRWRLAGGIVFALGIACIQATGSRAAMVGFVLVSFIILLWHSRWIFVLTPTLAVLVLVIAGPGLLEPIHAWYVQLVASNDIRLMFPRAAWELTQAVPLGCGFGRTVVFQAETATWAYDVVPAGAIWGGFNSFWLNLFCRLGLPGLLAFALALAAIFRFVWKRTRRVDHPLAQAALVGLAAGFVGQWLIWLANNTFMLPGGGLNFWFMFGMAVAGARAFAPDPRPCLAPAGLGAIPPTLPFIPATAPADPGPATKARGGQARAAAQAVTIARR